VQADLFTLTALARSWHGRRLSIEAAFTARTKHAVRPASLIAFDRLDARAYAEGVPDGNDGRLSSFHRYRTISYQVK